MFTNKSRSYEVKLDNATVDELKQVDAVECDYKIVGHKENQDGTINIRAYLRFKSQRAPHTVAKMLGRHIVLRVFEVAATIEAIKETYEICHETGVIKIDTYKRKRQLAEETQTEDDPEAKKPRINKERSLIDAIDDLRKEISASSMYIVANL